MMIRDLATEAVAQALGTSPQAISLERTRWLGAGDYTTTAALEGAKAAGIPPRELAERMAQALAKRPEFSAVSVTGPGFVNVTLSQRLLTAALGEVVHEPEGAPEIGHVPRRVCLEYVSANPTGAIHVGNANGAATGAALAAMLRMAGDEVVTEYYVNDAGGQIETLGRCLRGMQKIQRGMTPSAGDSEAIGTSGYATEALARIAALLPAMDGASDLAAGQAAAGGVLAGILEDLRAFGAEFDRVSHESRLSGGVRAMMSWMEREGLVDWRAPERPMDAGPGWEPREQPLFRSTIFGDDKDRALLKADGSPTYFAADAVYHKDKLKRGYDLLVNVMGIDHAGYFPRLKAVVRAMSSWTIPLKIVETQMVGLADGSGNRAAMSKRLGNTVTLAQAVQDIGADKLRFALLLHGQDGPIAFDPEGMARDMSGWPRILEASDIAGRAMAAFVAQNRLYDLSLPQRRRALAKALPEAFAPEDRAAAVRIAETAQVFAEAVNRLEPFHLARHARDMAAIIVERAEAPDPETRTVVLAAASAMETCLAACGLPPRPTRRPEPSADHGFEP